MKTSKMGGFTTVSEIPTGTASVSTTNLNDYRRLLVRLTASHRTVNDATHAVFTFPIVNNALFIRGLKALAPPEKFVLRGFM